MTRANKAILWFLFTAIAFLSIWYMINPKFTHKAPATISATVLPPQPPITSFNLTSTNNQPFTEKSLRGFWTILFFGYTDCPDVCPATLSIMRETWNQYLPGQQPPAKFVFASINPQPDSVANLKEFLANFHEQFVGITGTPEQMNKLSKQLNVFVSPSLGKIEHTAALMLVDPQMKLRALFTPPLDPKAIAKDLDTIIAG